MTAHGAGQERPKFEVATVKPAAPNATPRNQIVPTSPNRLYIPSMTVVADLNEMNTIVVDRADGKLGPNVKVWDGTCMNGAKPTVEDQPSRPRCLSGYLPGRLLIDGATMFSVAEALSLPQGRPLVGDITGDRTGLTGRYTLELKYDFSPRRPADPNAPPEVSGQPSLGTAVQEQWGLRFERGPSPFRLVTVESAQQPAAN